jgi:hypothetical protein
MRESEEILDGSCDSNSLVLASRPVLRAAHPTDDMLLLSVREEVSGLEPIREEPESDTGRHNSLC